MSFDQDTFSRLFAESVSRPRLPHTPLAPFCPLAPDRAASQRVRVGAASGSSHRISTGRATGDILREVGPVPADEILQTSVFNLRAVSAHKRSSAIAVLVLSPLNPTYGQTVKRLEKD